MGNEIVFGKVSLYLVGVEILDILDIFQPAREAPKGPFGSLGQPACFGAGCYIEMATSYH